MQAGHGHFAQHCAQIGFSVERQRGDGDRCREARIQAIDLLAAPDDLRAGREREVFAPYECPAAMRRVRFTLAPSSECVSDRI